MVVCPPSSLGHSHPQRNFPFSSEPQRLNGRALDYDIGAYFEANGHGTVIFNEKAISVIRAKVMRPRPAQ